MVVNALNMDLILTKIRVMRTFIFSLFVLICITACCDAEFSRELAELNQEFDSFKKELDEKLLSDYNHDGIDDTWVTLLDDGTIHSYDRNFDGKPDEKHRFSKDDVLLSTQIDDNFDGNFETIVRYRYQVTCMVGVDQNNDKAYEIIFYYPNGSLREAYRYVKGNNKKENKIEHTTYKFGIQETLIERAFKGTEAEFSNRYYNFKGCVEEKSAPNRQ